ncbi:DUF2141 domain-containing protein [Colwellia sp. MSW7]|uniref:DUF2141 domain-containing protein n=1 Tax=Colwellia maritima TaxID=2912588 RepID=A0ABS9WYM7_9GAMM|nr:DUF2141 domain-containing protein [Colwellia maritima]MCI2282642.1 DUF2141 domain-containing protein [Colwellia maritima]
MTKFIITIFLFSIALFSNPSFSLELTVKVAKIKTIDKKIVMEVYLLTDTNSQDWQNLHLIDKKITEFDTDNQDIIFTGLQKRTYAIRLFQDINNNGLLDRSSNNIPLEPVGFSNNPSLFGGEPTPEDSAFVLTKDQRVTINLKHRKPKKRRKKHQ